MEDCPGGCGGDGKKVCFCGDEEERQHHKEEMRELHVSEEERRIQDYEAGL